MTTVQLPEKIKDASAVAQTCRHHWVIDAPDGPVSRGKCRACGEARDFKNTIDSTPWGEEQRAAVPEERVGVTIPLDDSPDDDDG